jgi:thiamine transport system permease protein
VVLAHVFLNLPLATRMILHGWQAIPAERFRLGASLGFPPGAVARHLEAPMLHQVLPGAFAAIFLICLTSFAVALTLGGGPGATTVELLIYQALRFDFDLGRAASLALVQFGLCAAVTLVAARLVPPALGDAGRGAPMPAPLAPPGWRRRADALVIALALAFLGLPMAMVVARGVPGLVALPDALPLALLRSIVVALTSAGIATAAALALALAIAARGPGHRWLEAAGMLPLAASPLVLGTGLFIVTRPLSPDLLALPVTVVVNAALVLPFLLRLLLPPARRLQADYGRLAQALGLRGAAALRLLVVPRLRRALGLGAGLAVALSMGDLGVIALFAGEGSQTLPLLVARLMGAYRMEAAAAASLILIAASFALFALFDRWGARDVDA